MPTETVLAASRGLSVSDAAWAGSGQWRSVVPCKPPFCYSTPSSESPKCYVDISLYFVNIVYGSENASETKNIPPFKPLTRVVFKMENAAGRK